MSKPLKISLTADEDFGESLARLRELLGAKSDAEALRKSMLLADIVMDHRFDGKISINEKTKDGKIEIVNIPLKALKCA